MYRVTNDCPTSDIIDVDLDEQPTEDADDEGVTQPTHPSKQSKKKRQMTIQVRIIVRMMLETI